MGFWSVLGKVAPIAAMAIPGIGPAIGMGAKAIAGVGAGLGALGSVANKAGNVGQVAGGAARGMLDQRLQEAMVNQQGDRNRLDAARLGLEAPDIRARQAARGDLQANVQDVNLDFKPTTGAMPQFNVSGGVRPSAMGPNARQAGSEMSRQALLALMNKSDVPQMTGPAKAGAGEKVLGGVGLGTSLLGAASPVLDLLKKRAPNFETAGLGNVSQIPPGQWPMPTMPGPATPPYAGPLPQPFSPRVKPPVFG